MSEFVSGFITQTKMDFTIRAASLEDCKDIRRMMSTSFFHAIIAEVPEEHKAKDGHTKIGFSMYFYSYSSWKGRAVGGLVCDARVQSPTTKVFSFRTGKGIGKALMSKVAQLGRAAGCTQLNFTVLNWNKTALDFYLNQGSTDVTSDLGYHCMCCHGLAFQKLADKEF
ncbi:hypothetical protein QTP86_029264 [Hemibagrus guttatus]|nr:hypothetical protein QTP86_029264 [Hemibagrus guttatus]